MSSRRQWRPQFSPSEFRRGWVFFALYLVVFPVLMGQLQALLSLRFHFFLQSAEFSLIYYFVLLCAALVSSGACCAGGSTPCWTTCRRTSLP